MTAPMAIRGAPQADVQQRFVEVQEMAVRFLLEQSGRPADGPRFADWLKAMTAAAELAYSVQGQLAVEWIRDVQDLVAVWNDLLDNKVPPGRGLMVSLL